MTDKDLIELILKPESKNYGFNILIRTYQQKVYWLCKRMVIDHDDADDLTQITFIKVFEKIENYRSDAKLYTWIYRIATNECLMFLNKKRKRFFIPIIDVERDLGNKLEADVYFDGNEIEKKLQKAILTLPEKQRLVFNLKYFEEMKYEDMAEILDTSVGALKASYHHAVKKIEESLKAD